MTQALGGWMANGGVLGGVGYLASLVLAGVLGRAQYRLKADERRAWWASSGRDLLNAVAVAAVSGGLWLLGFRGPLVVAIGGTVVLLLSLFEMRLEASPRSAWWSVGAAVLLGLPALLRPAAVDRLLQETLRALIP